VNRQCGKRRLVQLSSSALTAFELCGGTADQVVSLANLLGCPVLNDALTYVRVLANRSTVLGAAKNSPIFKFVATACVGVVGILSFVVLVETVFGLG
jgi:hypothetical protein